MFKSYTQLPFMDDKAKVNASYCVTKLLPNLVKDCRHLMSDNFIFQQDGASAHAAALTKTGSRRNALVSLEKANGHQIRQILVQWIIMTADIHRQKRLNCWRKSCAKFDSLFLNIQDATACSLEKVNFKV